MTLNLIVILILNLPIADFLGGGHMKYLAHESIQTITQIVTATSLMI